MTRLGPGGRARHPTLLFALSVASVPCPEGPQLPREVPSSVLSPPGGPPGPEALLRCRTVALRARTRGDGAPGARRTAGVRAAGGGAACGLQLAPSSGLSLREKPREWGALCFGIGAAGVGGPPRLGPGSLCDGGAVRGRPLSPGALGWRRVNSPARLGAASPGPGPASRTLKLPPDASSFWTPDFFF